MKRYENTKCQRTNSASHTSLTFTQHLAIRSSGGRFLLWSRLAGGFTDSPIGVVANTLVEPADQEELNRTEVLLGSSRLTVLRAVVLCFIQSPSNAIRALVTSLRMATREHRLRHVGYFAIACRLARRMRELGCRHVHAHFGTNSAAVACLARIVGGFSWCSQNQIAAMLARSRALVLSNREEGLPIAIMEAFAAGRPAIATNVGGVKELVQPGVTGWLVPSGDVNALAKAMQQCLASPTAELRHMGENARNLIKSYDIRRSAAALVWRFEAAIAG